MRFRVLFSLALLALTLAACALRDTDNPATPLPVTLNPPPTMVLSGVCDLTPTLEAWLQASVQLRDAFLNQMTAAASQSRADAREGVVNMAALRDQTAALPAPDCAMEAQIVLVQAMTLGVDTFQKFVNGEADSIGTVVADVQTQIAAAKLIQDNLIVRFNQQNQDRIATLQAQLTLTPAP